ncbi:hypothetical protein [Psychrobacter urativorans]|uniref:Uncharacterized protein n=1 Tax=Psychrobacter urativorans TaxID=45610 RepID=A0A0M3V9M8_9GAMM|nr:hypothetical protein [Psychrobacter urativorans]ALF60947.1 hypothetical protein AOC03_12260 [Psychrobacter urativorans]
MLKNQRLVKLNQDVRLFYKVLLKKMAAENHESKRALSELTRKALDENYVSDRDKDIIIEYINSK